ncbi:hypothetical protein HI914_05122 [Erysiphe necator]|nr:hypothetical protein HI914_05122 [Erysiphe necator]
MLVIKNLPSTMFIKAKVYFHPVLEAANDEKVVVCPSLWADLPNANEEDLRTCKAAKPVTLYVYVVLYLSIMPKIIKKTIKMPPKEVYCTEYNDITLVEDLG